MPNLFSRIGIGTAGWGKSYNGVRVPDDDQKKILDYAMSCGIDMIDTATAYGADWTTWNSYFKVVLKISQQDDAQRILKLCEERRLYCIMAHSSEYYAGTFLSDYARMSADYCALGASLYVPGEEHNVFGGHIVQIPYSLYDRRFEANMEANHEVHEIHVRSIFLRGKILQAGVSPQECIQFCLCNPYIDRVIIGADSYEQFRQNVHFIHEWNRMEKHDEKLLDPRQWE